MGNKPKNKNLMSKPCVATLTYLSPLDYQFYLGRKKVKSYQLEQDCNYNLMINNQSFFKQHGISIRNKYTIEVDITNQPIILTYSENSKWCKNVNYQIGNQYYLYLYKQEYDNAIYHKTSALFDVTDKAKYDKYLIHLTKQREANKRKFEKKAERIQEVSDFLQTHYFPQYAMRINIYAVGNDLPITLKQLQQKCRYYQVGDKRKNHTIKPRSPTVSSFMVESTHKVKGTSHGLRKYHRPKHIHFVALSDNKAELNEFCFKIKDYVNKKCSGDISHASVVELDNQFHTHNTLCYMIRQADSSLMGSKTQPFVFAIKVLKKKEYRIKNIDYTQKEIKKQRRIQNAKNNI